MINNKEKTTINLTRIPLDSSLGLLAYGDLAFTAWRKRKQENKVTEKLKENKNEKK